MQPELFPIAEYLNPAYGMTARSTRSKATNRKAIALIHEYDRPINSPTLKGLPNHATI